MQSISRYINGAIEELHHVRWPTRQQAIRLSAIVLGFVAASTVVFGGIDYVLAKAVHLLLSSIL